MDAHVVTIGDEILIGQIVDTNSAWIGNLFNDNGIKVKQISSISDDLDAIVTTLSRSLDTMPITIVTGGLGPTKDDITKVAFCKLLGCELKEDKNVTEFLKDFLSSKGYPLNGLNIGQAYIPELCETLHNANGTAPGMWAERNGNIIVSLPGVPYEMKALMSDVVLPKIKSKFELGDITHKTMYTFGMPESVLAETIEDWETNLPKSLHLAYLPNHNGVKLRLSDYESPKSEALNLIDAAFAKLYDIIPDKILGFNAETVEVSLSKLLLERNETLSVAESCTGGKISSRITALSGSSAYYLGGVCTYANEVKSGVLGVSSDDLATYGAVSETVARQMAEGVKRLTGSTYSIATTGIAGPTGGTEDKPVGTVWFAIATPEGVFSEKKIFGQLREPNIDKASSFGLGMLRDKILK
ncbi:MAG: CinA family nicotinamide mononucleotide deamidase-related protein [Rikenellaceae bacterium]